MFHRASRAARSGQPERLHLAPQGHAGQAQDAGGAAPVPGRALEDVEDALRLGRELRARRGAGGRGLGEPVRDFLDLPPEADIVSMFVHRDGRKLLLAATSGHGFVTMEDEAVAMTRSGKKVMNVPPGIEAAVCTVAEGDSVAVLGENRKLLIFPAEEVPELGRGRGVILQRYRDGHLVDARVFTWKEGLRDSNGRSFGPAELKEYRGERAQAGRIVPRGFSKANRFG